MAAPVWVTPPGDLGKIVEGEFYQIQLNAANAVSYSFHSGLLPDGIEVKANGTVEGYPSNYNYIQGVPSEVGKDVTRKFVVRALSDDGLVSDRVFELTVTGQDAPVIDTLPAENLGAYFDGDYFNQQLTATDNDPNDTLTWKIVSGALPDGLTLTVNGLLTGYIEPVPTLDGAPGFDVNEFDIGSFDFRTLSENKNYQFRVQVTDGKSIDTKTYTLFVYTRASLTADNDEITADNFAPTADSSTIESLFTADQTTLRIPALLTTGGDLGTFIHDNYYSIQFVAKDFDGDAVEFSSTGTLPPGLTLDADSGWLSGYIPSQAATKTTYNFSVSVSKKNISGYTSSSVAFSMLVIGDIDDEIIWPDTNLGILKTGQISELDIIAEIPSGKSVNYELLSGSASKLPQGLKLDERGFILGRASFEIFMLDTGDTTFDVGDIRTGETTFDREYTFTVRAYSNDGVIDTFETFTITVQPSSFKPYESVYIRALPTPEQRTIYETLIQNADDIPADDIYRPTDFSFGKQSDIRFLVATGLEPSAEFKYMQAVSKNHWNNTLRFGDLKTARALDSSGNVKYEVVYIELIDKAEGVDPVSGNPAPAAQRIDLKAQKGWDRKVRTSELWPKVSSSNFTVDQGSYRYAYPNAIENMRERFKTFIGSAILERTVLPDWMQSKQDDGTILGWTLGAPIVYCKPGTSNRIKFLLEKRTEIDLKKISFEADRYILDNNLSKYFDRENSKYTVTDETTFDADSSTETVFDGGSTEFYADVDVYVDQDVDDKYIKFPQVDVFR